MAMSEFKDSKSLYYEQKKEGRVNRSKPVMYKSPKIRSRVCEQHEKGVCEASREAIGLGLREELILCSGNIPPGCVIQKALANDKTLIEICQHAQQNLKG